MSNGEFNNYNPDFNINFYATQDSRLVHHFGIQNNARVIHTYFSFDLTPIIQCEASDVAVGDDGDLFIISEKTYWLLHLSAKGRVIRTMDLSAAGVREAEGIALDRDGTLWILSDWQDHPHLYAFDRNGMLLLKPDLHHLYDTLLLKSPQSIAVDHIDREDGFGRFWFVDNKAKGGVVLNVDDRFVSPKLLPDDWKQYFSNPQGITISSDGTIWLVGVKDGVGHLLGVARNGKVQAAFTAPEFGATRATTGIAWTGFTAV